jgi:hypothetical protein
MALSTSPVLDVHASILVLLGLMKWFVRCVMLVSVLAVLPAAAQTTATPGSITPGGVVTLGSSANSAVTPYVSPTISAQSPPSGAATNSGSGSSSGATAGSSGSTGGPVGGLSTGQGAAGSRPSAIAVGSGGGSSGSATAAPSSGVPAWVLCPPSGALGMQPFLAGTDLSCAP